MTPDLSTARFFRPIRMALHGCDTFFGMGVVWVYYGFHASPTDALFLCAAAVLLQAGSGCVRHLMRWSDRHGADMADLPTRRRLGELFLMAAIAFGAGLALAMSRGGPVLAFAAARAALGLVRAFAARRCPFCDGVLAGGVRLLNVLMGMALYPALWAVWSDPGILLPLALVTGHGLCVGMLDAMPRDRLRDMLVLAALLMTGLVAWAAIEPSWTARGAAIVPYLALALLAGGAAATHPGWHGALVRAGWCGGVLLEGALLVYLASGGGGRAILTAGVVCLVPAFLALLPTGQDDGGSLEASPLTRTF